MRNILNSITIAICLLIGATQYSNADENFDELSKIIETTEDCTNFKSIDCENLVNSIKDVADLGILLSYYTTNNDKNPAEETIKLMNYFISEFYSERNTNQVIDSLIIDNIKTLFIANFYSFSKEYKNTLSSTDTDNFIKQQSEINSDYQESIAKITVSAYEMQMNERQSYMKHLDSVQNSKLTPEKKLRKYYAIEYDLFYKTKIIQNGFREPIRNIAKIREDRLNELYSSMKYKEETKKNNQ